MLLDCSCSWFARVVSVWRHAKQAKSASTPDTTELTHIRPPQGHHRVLYTTSRQDPEDPKPDSPTCELYKVSFGPPVQTWGDSVTAATASSASHAHHIRGDSLGVLNTGKDHIYNHTSPPCEVSVDLGHSVPDENAAGPVFIAADNNTDTPCYVGLLLHVRDEEERLVGVVGGGGGDSGGGGVEGTGCDHYINRICLHPCSGENQREEDTANMGQHNSTDKRYRHGPYEPPPGNNPELFFLDGEHKRERTSSFGSSRKKDRYVLETRDKEKNKSNRQRPTSDTDRWLSNEDRERLFAVANAKQDNRLHSKQSPKDKERDKGKDSSSKKDSNRKRSNSFSQKDKLEKDRERNKLLRHSSVREKNGFTPHERFPEEKLTYSKDKQYICRPESYKDGSNIAKQQEDHKYILSKQDREKEGIAIRKLESYRKKKAALASSGREQQQQQQQQRVVERPVSLQANYQQKAAVPSSSNNRASSGGGASNSKVQRFSFGVERQNQNQKLGSVEEQKLVVVENVKPSVIPVLTEHQRSKLRIKNGTPVDPDSRRRHERSKSDSSHLNPQKVREKGNLTKQTEVQSSVALAHPNTQVPARDHIVILPPYIRPISDQNRNKATKSSTTSSVKRPNQPDVVTNSVASPGAAEEIARLEALCETRTKQLNIARMQLKASASGFDAMAVLVKYLTEELDAFSCPEVTAKLKAVKAQLSDAQQQIDALAADKVTLEKELSELRQQHVTDLQRLNDSHQGELKELQQRLQTEKEKEVENVVEKYSHEVATLKNFLEKNISDMKAKHEKSLQEKEAQHTDHIEKIKQEHDLRIKELQKQHEKRMEEITKTFENIKFTLSDKVEALRGECEEMRSREAQLQERAQHEADLKIHMALAKYQHLPAEIESLRAVMDMRNQELHELRSKKLELEKQLEELPRARDKIVSLQQKVENLEAVIEIKGDYEKQLAEKHQILLRKFEKESKANKRLSMDNEELAWRLANSAESPDLLRRSISHSPTRTSAEPTPEVVRRRKSPACSIPTSPRNQTEFEQSPVTPQSPPKSNLKRSGTYDLLHKDLDEKDMKQSDV